MADASTSSSACMVSMTTRTWGSDARISRVAPTPSSSGMVTSIRTTSGCSRWARSTAWAPSAASPTTLKPCSVIDRRRPSRSMRWSSASIRRTAGAPSAPPGGAGEATGAGGWMVMVSVPLLEEAANPGPPAFGRGHLDGGTDAGGPFLHAEDPVRIEAAGLPDGEALAVVQHLEGGGHPVAAPRHPGLGGLGVALDVDQRLLGDAPHLPLLEERQAGALVAVDVDGQPAA